MGRICLEPTLKERNVLIIKNFDTFPLFYISVFFKSVKFCVFFVRVKLGNVYLG